MRRVLRIGLYSLGTLLLLSAVLQTPTVLMLVTSGEGSESTRAVWYLVGLFLPCLLCFLIGSMLREKSEVSSSVGAENRRDVVRLTPNAAELFATTVTQRKYPNESVLRVVVTGTSSSYDVQYDLPSDSRHDWVGESEGIVVVVDKKEAAQLEGMTVDAVDGRFVFFGSVAAGE